MILVKEILEYQAEHPISSADTDDPDDEGDQLYVGGSRGSSRSSSTGKNPKGNEKSRTPVLDNFGRDLTKLAEEDKLDPIIGREKEIERVAQNS